MLNTNEEPRLTIGITTFDRIELLIETINSVRSQSFSNFNVLIANDNPNRKLDTKLLGIDNDSRFTLINHDTNLGEIKTLNLLLELSKSEFFTWLSDDDLIHPNFFQEALAALDKNRLAVAFYSSYSTGSTWKPNLDKKCTDQSVMTFDEFSFLTTYASKKTKLIGCYGIFRRTAILATGGFLQLGTGFAPYSDTLIPILISAQGNILFSQNQLVFLRTHENSLSNSSQELRSYTSSQRDFITVLNNFSSTIPKEQRDEIFRDFFTWFSNDRAAVICRSSGFIVPLFTQIKNDFVFLGYLKVKFDKKLFLLPSLINRLILSARSLIREKMIRQHS
jgi:glycosyltransferase involved in cell wall biosynthesis